MLLLGLTGDIACGKSTVARWLVERGAVHLDSDLLVRELYADVGFARDLAQQLYSRHSRNRVIDVEPFTILNAEGKVDRRALGQWVFGNAEHLKTLEERVHPAVAALREQKIDELRHLTQPPPIVVLEAVKLVESGQAQGCDVVWWIIATREVQMQRLIKDRGLNKQEAELRLLHQPDATQKSALLDKLGVPHVFIDNSATKADLQQRLATHYSRLQSLEPS